MYVFRLLFSLTLFEYNLGETALILEDVVSNCITETLNQPYKHWRHWWA